MEHDHQLLHQYGSIAKRILDIHKQYSELNLPAKEHHVDTLSFSFLQNLTSILIENASKFPKSKETFKELYDEIDFTYWYLVNTEWDSAYLYCDRTALNFFKTLRNSISHPTIDYKKRYPQTGYFSVPKKNEIDHYILTTSPFVSLHENGHSTLEKFNSILDIERKFKDLYKANKSIFEQIKTDLVNNKVYNLLFPQSCSIQIHFKVKKCNTLTYSFAIIKEDEPFACYSCIKMPVTDLRMLVPRLAEYIYTRLNF